MSAVCWVEKLVVERAAWMDKKRVVKTALLSVDERVEKKAWS